MRHPSPPLSCVQGRTYVVVRGPWTQREPLGTVVAPSRPVAWNLVAERWPHESRRDLRLVTAAVAVEERRADLLGRALAMDAARR